MFELQTTYKASLQYVKVNNDYLINSDQQNIILYLISQNISETKALTELKKKKKRTYALSTFKIWIPLPLPTALWVTSLM